MEGNKINYIGVIFVIINLLLIILKMIQDELKRINSDKYWNGKLATAIMFLEVTWLLLGSLIVVVGIFIDLELRMIMLNALLISILLAGLVMLIKLIIRFIISKLERSD